jgi:NAD+ kinase
MFVFPSSHCIQFSVKISPMRFTTLLKPSAFGPIDSTWPTIVEQLLALGHTHIPIEHISRERPDVCVSVGGDGTLLHAMRVCAPLGVPLVGVHQGHLGFLTSVGYDHAAQSLHRIFSGQHAIERRVLLDVSLYNKHTQCVEQHSIAANDAVLRSGEHLLSLSWHVDQKQAAVWRADGMIVATPTGSTAYALSAGGALLEPELSAMTVVPLCPQSLTHRPLVLSGQRTISLSHNDNVPQRCALDGQIVWWVGQEHELRIRLNEDPAILWRDPSHDFYDTLRRKLGWNVVDAHGFPLAYAPPSP